MVHLQEKWKFAMQLPLKNTPQSGCVLVESLNDTNPECLARVLG